MSTKQREDGVFKLESEEKEMLEDEDDETDAIEVIDDPANKPFKASARFEKK